MVQKVFLIALRFTRVARFSSSTKEVGSTPNHSGTGKSKPAISEGGHNAESRSSCEPEDHGLSSGPAGQPRSVDLRTDLKRDRGNLDLIAGTGR